MTSSTEGPDMLIAQRRVEPGELVGYYPLPFLVTYRQKRRPIFNIQDRLLTDLIGTEPKHVSVAWPRCDADSLEKLGMKSDLMHLREPIVAYCKEALGKDKQELACLTDQHSTMEERVQQAQRFVSVLPLASQVDKEVVRTCLDLCLGALELVRPGTSDVWGVAFAPPVLKKSMMPGADRRFNSSGLVLVNTNGSAVLAVFNRNEAPILDGDPIRVLVLNVLNQDMDLSCHMRFIDDDRVASLIGRANILGFLGRKIVHMCKIVRFVYDADGLSAADRNFIMQRFQRLDKADVKQPIEPHLSTRWEDRNVLRAEVDLNYPVLLHTALKIANLNLDDPRDDVLNLFARIANVVRMVAVACPWVYRSSPSALFHVRCAKIAYESLHVGGSHVIDTTLEALDSTSVNVRRLLRHCMDDEARSTAGPSRAQL